MTKTIRTVKASIVMGILLFSLFAVFMPLISAAPIKNNAYLQLEYDASAVEKNIMPLGGSVSIPIKVSYLVTGVFAAQAVGRFSDMNVPALVDLSVEVTPEYCTAWVEPNVIKPAITTGWSSVNANLFVSFSDKAPAMTEVKIQIKMHAKKIASLLYEIGEATAIGEVSFTPGYLPTIGITLREGNFKEISPGQTATFNIDIENLGNAKTEVTFRIVDIPKDWSPTIKSSIIIGAAVGSENDKATVQLTVQPPYGFGYHNDRKTIGVEITPSYYGDATLVGKTYTEYFTVQSRGFSTPGFEAVFMLIALVAVVLMVRKLRKSR